MNYFYLILSFIVLATDLTACTRIFWNVTPCKLSGRTMDLNEEDSPEFLFSPRGTKRLGNGEENALTWVSKHGSVVITAFEGRGVSEGMNEKGLSAQILYLDATEYEKRDNRPGLSNALWVQFLLDQFSSVNEVLQSLDSFQVVATEVAGRVWPLHLALADPSGDSAVIEYVEGKISIHHGPHYRVVTNDPIFPLQLRNRKQYQSLGGLLPTGHDSMSRFVRSSALLEVMPQPKNDLDAVVLLFSLMSHVQIPDQRSLNNPDPWPTRWISIQDLTGKIYYFQSLTHPNTIWISLEQLDFSPHQEVRYISLQNSRLKGDITELLAK